MGLIALKSGALIRRQNKISSLQMHTEKSHLTHAICLTPSTVRSGRQAGGSLTREMLFGLVNVTNELETN